MTQAVNDELVASLDYKLAAGNTNYIQSRKSVQFFPSSLSTFTPSTSRVCRIPITPGSDFVDPESIKLAFTFRNTDGSSDMLCGSPDRAVSSSAFSSSPTASAWKTSATTDGVASCTAY